MAMVVQHNLMAMNANRMLGVNTSTQAKSTEKLSSGYKINRAADDAAGLSISEKMRKQIRGLTQASLNAQDGISAVQTAEGALNEVQDMLQRMNELAVKAGNGTMSEDDRQYIQDEIDQLVTEIDRVSETTKFNETYLLKGAETETATEAKELGVSMRDVNKFETLDAKIVEATGNVYSGKITSTLGEGTDDTVKITYNDAEGHERTKEISFKAGEDAKATAANIAEAINNDETLKTMFKASSDKDGNLSVESLQNKYELANDDANKVKKLEFHSSDAVGEAARKTTITASTTNGAVNGVTAAKGTSYDLDITKLEDGDTITIDGKTYTYDSGKVLGTNDKTPANTFNSIAELKNLLGKDYDVSFKYTATQTTVSWDATSNNTVTTTKEVEGSCTTGTVKTSDLLDTTSGIGDAAYDPSTSFGLTAYQDTAPTKASDPDKVTYSDAKLSLVITKNTKPEEATEATKTKDPLHFSFQVGADTTAENKISVEIESMNAEALGVEGLKVDGKDSKNADAAVDVIAEALQKVSTQRSALGAVQNRLEHTIANLDNIVENTTSAESQIRDTDMATEMVKYSNNNILAQAGQAMLAQANQSNQGVLSLLG